jgi:exonuclease III
MFNGTWFVNIYAPSGAAKKQERESFYNTDITYLLSATHSDLILAGDFNCAIAQADATGHNKYSRTLANPVRGLNLTDARNAYTAKTAYTHYTPTGASRIDRIYISNSMKSKKK